MKDDFKLPEIFYIYSHNLEQSKIVAEWYNSKHGPRFDHTVEGEYFHPNKDVPQMFGERFKPHKYPIITFEQFQKHILNESIEETSEDCSYLIPLLKKLRII